MNPNYTPGNYPYDPRQYPQVPTVPAQQVHGAYPHQQYAQPNYPANQGYPGYGYGGYGYPAPGYAAQPRPQQPTPAANPQPTKPAEPQIEQWIPSEDERSLIDSWFIEADNNFKGYVGGAEAVQFMKKSNLAKETLREVWNLADRKKNGRLDRTEFFFAIRLIAILCSPIYAGSKPSIELYNSTINKRIPLPIQLQSKPEVKEEKKVAEVAPVPTTPSQSVHPPVPMTPVAAPVATQGYASPAANVAAPHPHQPSSHVPYPGYPPQPQSLPTGYAPGYHVPAAVNYPPGYGPAPPAVVAHQGHPPAAAYYQTGYGVPTYGVSHTPPPSTHPIPSVNSASHDDEEFSDFAGVTAAVPTHTAPVVTNTQATVTAPAPVLETKKAPQYQKGDRVWYYKELDSNQSSKRVFTSFPELFQQRTTMAIQLAEIVGIHHDDFPNVYYTVRLLPTKASVQGIHSATGEKQTDPNHLISYSPSDEQLLASNPVPPAAAVSEEDEFSDFAAANTAPPLSTVESHSNVSSSVVTTTPMVASTSSSDLTSAGPVKPDHSIIVNNNSNNFNSNNSNAGPVASTGLTSTPSDNNNMKSMNQTNYDPSKLSIFDELVENDLQAEAEDWEDFSGPAATTTTTNKDVTATTTGPIPTQPLSVNPFDDFDLDTPASTDYYTANNSGRDELNPSLTTSNTSHATSNPPSTKPLAHHSVIHPITIVSSPEEENNNDEDFGDFESHTDPMQPPPLERQESIHRSTGIDDLPGLKNHYKYLHQGGHLSGTSTPELELGGSGSEPTSSKFGGIMIEEMVHRSTEVVDFTNVTISSPEGSNKSLPSNLPYMDTPYPDPKPISDSLPELDNNDEDDEDFGEFTTSTREVLPVDNNDSGKTILSYTDYPTMSELGENDYPDDSEYNSGKFTNQQTKEKEQVNNEEDDFDDYQEVSTKQLGNNDEDTSPNLVPVSSNSTLKPVQSMDQIASKKEEEDDPFADIEIDPAIQMEFALKHAVILPEPEPEPLPVASEVKPIETGSNPVLSINANPIAVEEEDDDMGDFQDFQSSNVSPVPENHTSLTSAHPSNSELAKPTTNTTTNNDLMDLLDFSSSVATNATTTTSNHGLKPVASISDTFDLLSMDYTPSPVTNHNSNANTTAFDPFADPKPMEEDDEFDSFVAATQTNTTATTEQKGVNNPPVFEATFEADFESASFDPFNTNNNSTAEPPRVTPASTTTSAATATTKTVTEPKKTPSAPPAVSHDTQPMTQQQLEILAVLLMEQGHYEVAYQVAQQADRLRVMSDLSEQKKNALENDELELAVDLKKRIQVVMKQLVSKEMEYQWIVLSQLPTSSNDSDLTLSEYEQRLFHSKQLKLGKTFQQKIVQSYPLAVSSSVNSHAPLVERLREMVLTKHAVHRLYYLLSHQYYDLYEKIYRELLAICKAQLVLLQQSIQQYQEINKPNIQTEIKNHSHMKKFVSQGKLLVEVSLLLAVVAMELLFYDRSTSNHTSSTNNQKKKVVGSNLAIDVFEVCQELLEQFQQLFDESSEFTKKSCEDILLLQALLREELPQENIVYCHLLFLPLEKQCATDSGKKVYHHYKMQLNSHHYHAFLINLIKKEKKELMIELGKVSAEFQ